MPRRALAVLVVAAVLAVVVWSLGGPGPEDARPVLPLGAPLESASSAPLVVLAGDSGPRTVAPSGGSVEGVRIEVVLAATGARLPSAGVRFGEVQSGWVKSKLGGLLTRRNTLDVRALRSFERAVSEGDGNFRVPEPKEALVVVANLERKGRPRLTGYAFLGPLFDSSPGPSVRLELAPMGVRTVRVVGRDGLPLVDHRVELSARAPWGVLVAPYYMTDKAGELRLRNIDSVLGPLVKHGRVTLETASWNGEPTRLEFPGNRVPPGPLVLVVDGGARVELRAVDENGQLVADREVRFSVSRETGEKPVRQIVWAESGGVARIDGVAPGTRMSAYELLGGDFGAAPERTVHGTAESGAPLVLNVPTERYPHILVTGRLVDGDGAPIVEIPIALQLVHDGRLLASQARGTTDAQGNFSIDRLAPYLGRSFAQDAQIVFRFARLDSTRGIVDSAAWLGPLPQAPASIELGELVLGPPPVLLAGVVVDSTGEPIEGALVLLGKRSVGDLPAAFFTQVSSVAQVTTDAAGHFELVGARPFEELAVRASKDKYIDSLDVDCALGDVDLRIELRKGGRMGGFLVLGDTLAKDWDVGIWPEDEGADESFIPKPVSKSWHTNSKWIYSSPFPRSGLFAWIELPAGRYSVRVISRSGGDEVTLVRGVTVETGKDCRDPRLQGIDVSQIFNVVEVYGRDSKGAPVDRLEVGVAREADQHVEYFSASDGVKLLRLESVPREIYVRAPGYRTARFQAFAGPNEVILEPDLHLELQLPEGLDWSRVGAPMARLKCKDWHNELVYQIEHPFNETGTAMWGVGAPGEYEVTVTTPAWRLASDPEMRAYTETISVPEGGIPPGSEPIRLHITQADIDAR